MRNTPLLLQLLFWYNAVLKALPGPRQSLSLPASRFSTIAASICRARSSARARSASRWRSRPESPRRSAYRRLRAAPAGADRAKSRRSPGSRRWRSSRRRCSPISRSAGRSSFSFAELKGFNLRGGLQLYPEFVALVFGLVTYTAGFIAEIVRAGVASVSHGQTEAAAALGLPRGRALRLVVVPQALRLIIPPLTSQWLNIVKNSSLAVFIGYPDLVLVFAGTVLNQTQAAMQVMGVTMAVYLVISLLLSLALNVFNARLALKER